MTDSIRASSVDQTSERIVALMWRKRLTQTTVARQLGLVQATLSAKLHGRRPWFFAEIQSLARVLGTSVAYLSGETDNDRPAVEREEARPGAPAAPQRTRGRR